MNNYVTVRISGVTQFRFRVTVLPPVSKAANPSSFPKSPQEQPLEETTPACDSKGLWDEKHRYKPIIIPFLCSDAHGQKFWQNIH